MARPNDQAAIAGRIQGLREAKAAFQRMPQVVRDRLLAATEKTVQEIARQARARVMASPSVRTGALRDHIAWSINKNSGHGRAGIKPGTTVINGIRVRGIITSGRNGSALTSEGAMKVNPTRYAHLVEFGARHMRAEPFMLPSAAAEKEPYLQRCLHEGPAIERDLAAGRNL